MSDDYGLYNFLKRLIRENSLLNFKDIKIWGAKSFPNKDEAEGLIWLFPKAKFVYIYRNGIDVVNSMTKFGWFSKQSFKVLCDFWASRIFRYKYLTDFERAISVNFDVYVQNTEETFRKIFKHLEIDYNKRSVNFSKSNLIHPLDQPNQKISSREAFDKRKPPYENWTQKQKKIFREICSGAIKEMGFEIPF